MRTAPTARLRAAVAAAAALVSLTTLAACGGGDDGADDGGDGVAETTGGDPGGTVEEGTGDDDGPAGVPDECGEAFPQALGPADVADLALLPDGFPDPPVEATLCITAETVGGSQETASYATDATAEEILAGYETALASYGAVRDQDGIGRPIVTAADGDLDIQVTPQDGGFVLAFSG
ncbi:hypothetical protein KVF89_15060 [Nocardioides carbamazepini]|uniref:hypothetical protein n=1 Tax=Nocardioides carbamazepini TaxID=2854259 RepID=UPI00214A0762|nr:hypothetical protein [Nocardioides carbamazepini]MCR1783858.1 hypothetical protein [Nocardioides carbamazepini]